MVMEQYFPAHHHPQSDGHVHDGTSSVLLNASPDLLSETLWPKNVTHRIRNQTNNVCVHVQECLMVEIVLLHLLRLILNNSYRVSFGATCT